MSDSKEMDGCSCERCAQVRICIEEVLNGFEAFNDLKDDNETHVVLKGIGQAMADYLENFIKNDIGGISAVCSSAKYLETVAIMYRNRAMSSAHGQVSHIGNIFEALGIPRSALDPDDSGNRH